MSDLGEPMYLSSEGFYVVVTNETGSYWDIDPDLHFECLKGERTVKSLPIFENFGKKLGIVYFFV